MIIEQADRLRNLVDRLLDHSIRACTESIHKVAERVVKLVSMELPEVDPRLRPQPTRAPHDPDQIEQVLLNIVRNALQALGPENYSSHPHRFPADAARGALSPRRPHRR